MELKDAVITYLLRPRETVCFVDPRPPLLPRSRGLTIGVLLYSVHKCQSMNNLPVIGVNFETKTR